MLSDELVTRLAPFRLVASRNALAPAYRAIELSPARVKACSSFAMLESKMELGISETVFVDAMAFLSIVQSLPPKSDMILQTKTDGTLSWSCGPASGKLACMNVSDVPDITPSSRTRKRHQTTTEMARALECGSISCDNNALGAIGIYGVVIHNAVQTVFAEPHVLICSTDNITVSSCAVDDQIVGAPDVSTFPPPGAELLAAVMDNTGTLEFDDKGVVYRSGSIACMVRQVPELKTDIYGDIVTQFGGSINIGKVPNDRISAFIKRANALTESKRQTQVVLGAADGCITLSFAEGTATSDEYILAESLGEFPDIEPVSLPASKLARALKHIDSVVLDYIDRGVIIFQGGNFRYLVSGSVAQ